MWFLTLLFTLSSTNLTQAQTKEETIFWLKEYGLDMLLDNSKDSDIRTYYNIEKNKFEKLLSDGYSFTLNFDCLSNAYLDSIKIQNEANEEYFTLYVKFKNKCITHNISGDDNTYVLNYFFLRFKSTTSQQDQERFLKAFRHLAQLCGAKEKPKVKKNTF